jgi:hypothetical protein
MAKSTTRRPAQRQRKGPANQSRGAGAAAPASAAATAPRPPIDRNPFEEPAATGAGFYRPEGDSGRELGDSPLSLASEPLIERSPRDAVDLHEESDHSQSADVEVLAAVEEKPNPGAEETYEQQIARIREMRRPLGEFHLKLDIEKRRGYHTHWFNDAGARIDEAVAAGWAFRTRDGQRVRRAVGVGRDRGVLYAYAMDLPIVFWQEDMAARHKQATEKMESLKSAPFRARPGAAKPSDSGKFYSPVEGQEPIRQEHIDHL